MNWACKTLSNMKNDVFIAFFPMAVFRTVVMEVMVKYESTKMMILEISTLNLIIVR